MKSKKKLLLLGVGAMGALAMGVGATSTFAWFAATAAGTTTPSVLKSDLVSTTTVTSAGSFEIAITNIRFDKTTIALTNTSGDTYVWNGTKNIQVADEANQYATVTADITVSYSGSETNPTVIASLWSGIISSKAITYEVKDNSRLYREGGTKADQLPVGKTACAANGGLKFHETAASSVGATVNATLSGSSIEDAIDDFTFAKAADATQYEAKTASDAISFGVAIAGVDSVYQYATDYYEFEIAAKAV